MTSEKFEASLPASEFDPRAARPLHDSMFDLSIITASKVKGRIAGLILDLEALRVVNGDSGWLQASAQLPREIVCCVDEHAAATAAKIGAGR